MPVVRGKQIRVLFDEQTISTRISVIAEEIGASEYHDLLVVSILKGSFVFAADLIRALHDAGLAPDVEFLSLSSYGTGTESSGTVNVVRDIDSEVKGRDVLLIDDILESGRTASFARQMMVERGARSVEMAVLLDKAEKRVLPIDADFVGFPCPDFFVIGYGMDVAHAFRELPYVGIVEGDA
jgi:hypoxanthine phosphoribosyltransferase